MSRDDGGPAFPGETQDEYVEGMSLRDYFAGQALAGCLADPNEVATLEDIAERCYAVADAMIQEKRKAK